MDKEELIRKMKSLSGVNAFENADESLRGDKEVCLEAVLQNPRNFKFVSDEMKKNLDFVFEAFRLSPVIWEYVDESIRTDKNIILQAISHLEISYRGHSKNDWVLEFLPEELKKDKDIIFALIEKGTTAEKYFKELDESLKNDRNFVLEAVRRNGKTIFFFPKKFLADREVVCEALKDLKVGRQAGLILEDIEDIKPEFYADKELMALAARNNASMAMFCATEEVKKDRKFILAVAEQSIRVLREQLPEELRSDREILQILMQKLSNGMEKARTVPEWIREGDIKGWRMPVNEIMRYGDIRTNYTHDILGIIGYFDSELLEEYKEVLAEYSEENFLSAEAIRECVKEKGDGDESVIGEIATLLQQRQEKRLLEMKAEAEKREAEVKARQAETKKEEVQEPRTEVDERTTEIQKALAGLAALNLTAEEIEKLTAQLGQLKAKQTQQDIGSKGE